MTDWGLVGAAAGALGVVWTAATWNRLVRLRNRAEEAWSGVEVQLKRRHDLVPSLVEVVKGYAGHEHRVLTDVVAARTESRAADRRAEEEQVLADRIVRLVALVEDYPELRADRQFLRLHHDLVEIEDALQYARRYFNGVVREHNVLVDSVPSLLVARVGGFGTRPYFELESSAERLPPTVDLGTAPR